MQTGGSRLHSRKPTPISKMLRSDADFNLTSYYLSVKKEKMKMRVKREVTTKTIYLKIAYWYFFFLLFGLSFKDLNYIHVIG